MSREPRVTLAKPWLVVRLPGPHAVISWALSGGGRRQASTVAWLEVRNDDLGPDVDARAFLGERLRAADLAHAVAMMTSHDVGDHDVVRVEEAGVAATVVATVGLENAVRIGDPAAAPRLGTINMLCCVSAPLGEEALVEALSLVAEARTAAVIEAGLESRLSGASCTGTGTDCIVLAAPEPQSQGVHLIPGRRGTSPRPTDEPEAGAAAPFAGKHTALGHVIGRAAFDATARGVARWLARYRWER